MTNEVNIGTRIKERRNQLSLSIRELARQTGLSASFISQIERGKSNPSLESIRNIANVLEVTIPYFFSKTDTFNSSSEKESPCKQNNEFRDEYSPVVRSNCRPRLHFPESGVTYEMLIPDMNRKMEAFYGRLSPGSGNVARRLRKPTEEWIFVLSGALLVGLENREYILNAGDSMYFEGNDLNKIICASEEQDVMWISVITPPVF